MIVNFYKYQGAGNDFVIFDNRNNILPRKNTELYKKLCDRRFGIGGDGLMLLQTKDGYDFEMVYYNSDGHEGTMCGNGGRCIVAFAHKLGVIKNKTSFWAIDGEHQATVIKPELIDLKMQDVKKIEAIKKDFYLNTGSPHYVSFKTNLQKFNVFDEGQKIRYSDRFEGSGTNVNFVEEQGDKIFVRTYERGVEDETLACGTGVVASAISTAIKRKDGSNAIEVDVLGGDLSVRFEHDNYENFSNIWLKGPANFVFEGSVEV